jgi:hypothetical protein
MIAEINPELPAPVDNGLERIHSYVIRIRPVRREDLLPFLARLVRYTSEDTVQRYFAWSRDLEAEEICMRPGPCPCGTNPQRRGPCP